mmetsp:Transcript_22933/g.36833  ORF Transcript_22933/g.36833 Transcript_22933/m.36833 type:complete len:255 (-) Transcript_22933:100-864(-)
MARGGGVVIRFVRGCITKVKAEAIVTSSNPTLSPNSQKGYWRFAGRNNVNGAVHQAGGTALAASIKGLELNDGINSSQLVRCKPGGAVCTPAGGELSQNTSYVIHCCVPDGLYGVGDNGSQTLKETFDSCFEVANELGVRSIAFPALGCGVQGWRPAVAFHAALQSIEHNTRFVGNPSTPHCNEERKYFEAHDLDNGVSVSFVLYSDHVFKVWMKLANEIFGGKSSRWLATETATKAENGDESMKYHEWVMTSN